ncbi:MAG TPA: hypothetical protein VHM20_03435 [Gammaproteobacteria bacterium]|nr:hypothetical protein [Gammaproteobacteria bacterium]
MFLKKIFYTTTLVMLTAPLAHANFETFNYTNEDSSVRVTSGLYQPCSMDFGIYTPKKYPDDSPGYFNATDSKIKTLCLTSTNNVCTADIYNTKNCTGEKIGQASLDLTTYRITEIVEISDHYTLQRENDGRKLNIRYKN